MNIVFIDNFLTIPPTGGAHTFLVDLAAALVKRGWEVSVVTQPGPESGISTALLAGGANVIMDLWTNRDLPEEKAAKLASWVNAFHPDAFVVSASPDVGWLALPYLHPSIATFSIAHNDVGAFYEPLKHYQSFIDVAIGVSEAIHRKLIEECGVPPERARQIPYGVSTVPAEEISGLRNFEGSGPLKIGYVGRLVQEQKRVMDFVPLVRELGREKVPFELHLIGAGPDRAALENALAQERLSERVKFLGWLGPAQVKAELRKLDVFILLSDYEGLPVALLEAMGHGVTPLVTRIESGNNELVRDGENGLVVDVGDIKGFAKRLQSLSTDRKKLAELSRAAWMESQKYSLERMADSYAATFEHAAAVSSRKDRKGVISPYPVMRSCRSKYPFWLRKVKRVFVSR